MASRKRELAEKAIGLTKAALAREAPLVWPAIGELEVVVQDPASPAAPLVNRPLGTDGRRLFINPDLFLHRYLDLRMPPAGDLLHVLIHCLLGHPRMPQAVSSDPVEARRWNLACDIEACRMSRRIAEDGFESAQGPSPSRTPGDRKGMERRNRLLRELAEEAGQTLSLPALRRAFADGLFSGRMPELEAAFRIDDHRFWCESAASGSGASADPDETARAWTRLAGSMGLGPQGSPLSIGRDPGDHAESFTADRDDTRSYRAFLRRFAMPGEIARLSDDEFDSIFYTYGLKLYGNLPLIEPIEYREDKRIREFVIVIDTSGSVYGETVRRFVSETFSILSDEAAFFDDVNLHIIQCDEQVRSDVRISTLGELDSWKRTMRLEGFGGTDFRPAFEYVDRLVEEGQFERLGGLIYFTDGWGVYPRTAPSYQTAFVFCDDNHRAEDVPPWAVQLTLPNRPRQDAGAMPAGRDA